MTTQSEPGQTGPGPARAEPGGAASAKAGQTGVKQAGGAATAGGNRWPESGMRVSDADRALITDRLSAHFSDGRLDQAEFEARLDRAMRAKTRADLIGLLSDLPEGLTASVDGPDRSRGQRRRERQLLKIQLERERLLLAHERREHRRQERELRRHSLRQLPVIVALIVLVLAVGSVLRHLYSPWLVIAVLVFLWLRYVQRGRTKS
jgi:DUF1707 SHOCT-like domain